MLRGLPFNNPLLDLDAADLPSFEAVSCIRTDVIPSGSQPLGHTESVLGSIYSAYEVYVGVLGSTLLQMTWFDYAGRSPLPVRE